MTNLQSKVESLLLPYTQNPMRYVGSEINIIKKDLAKVNLHGVLCFPDLYDIGMSHHGLQILYHIVNQNLSWALSRCFHPWTDAEKQMRENNIPLYSLEYFTPIKEADWVGFTVQYELQYTNIVNMLDLSKIPILSKDRTNSDPIIVAGGPCIGNPEPLSDFIDVCFLGDGEEGIRDICKLLEEAKVKSWERNFILEKLATIEGCYVPSLFVKKKSGPFYTSEQSIKISARKEPTLQHTNYPQNPIVPLIDVVHHRLAVEVMRGCTRGCRFCSAGSNYRPVRERIPTDIFNQIVKNISTTGWRDIGLLSLSTADYTSIEKLLEMSKNLKEQYHIDISLPSTRIDALSEDQLNLLDQVSPSSSFTIAPEAGSDRLRKVINKNFTDEKILSTVELLLKKNVQTIKLYFMIGLPTETQEDIDAIIKIVEQISIMTRNSSKRKSINVAISPFSPKPHTPFQWEAMESTEKLFEKGRYIKSSLQHRKNVKVSYRDSRITLLETIMARGDSQISKLIIHAWEQGAKFDGWDEFFDLNNWIKAAQDLEIDFNIYTNEIPKTQPLPWSHISMGVSESYLIDELNRAYKEESSDDCRMSSCLECGVCHDSIQNLNSSQINVESNQLVKSEEPQVLEIKNSEIKSIPVYRLFFCKGTNLRFLGHLDMVNIFQRAFTAAHIPVAFTNGFHPHPKIAFGPPLPLGVSGSYEALDVTISTDDKINFLRANNFLPSGLEIFAFDTLEEKAGALNQIIRAAEYKFHLVRELPNKRLKERIVQFQTSANCFLTIEKNGVEKQKDIRALTIKIDAQSDSCFTAWLRLEPNGTCKPSELLKVLFPELVFSDFSINRKFCLVQSSNGYENLIHSSKKS